MKKVILLFLMCFICFSQAVSADTLDSAQIKDLQQIGELYRSLTHSGEEYVIDKDNNIIGGPYKAVSDCSGYCYVLDDNYGNQILFDLDGTIIATAPTGYDITYPKNGIYTIRERKESDDAELTIYDYETNTELLKTTGTFLYHLEQQSEKMFISKNGKYAIVDNKCNFITDYIYDDVKKRFNPEYVPFPKAYAILVENGVEKYIDWDLDEINLDDYNGEPFITNCWRIHGYDGYYKEFYVLENGTKTALYNMENGEFIFPYQTEYEFRQMNDKYIIVSKGEEMGVLDYSGKIVVAFSESQLSLTENGLVSYYHFDGETVHEGVLNPEDGTAKDNPLEHMGYFHQVIGEDDRENIAFGVIVSNGKAADIRNEDLKNFLDRYWNFYYERVIAPIEEYTVDNLSILDDTYIKLWNKDKNKSYIIYDNSSVMLGQFGEKTQSHGMDKTNYVWYFPVVGNGRNALYTAFETVRHTYFDKEYEGYFEAQREITEADKIEIPTENILPIDGASEWSKPEIQKAAACNLLIYELTDKYTENITRLDFCYLARRLIATEFSPESDSRMGISTVIGNIIEERGLTERIAFSDCENDAVDFLTRAGIIEGMGDETFAPDAEITREQAATILYRMAKFLGNKTLKTPQTAKAYDDEGLISEWAKSSVLAMKEMGIMKGISDTEFSPKGNYTVEQSIATMLRLYECY